MHLWKIQGSRATCHSAPALARGLDAIGFQYTTIDQWEQRTLEGPTPGLT